MRALLVFVLFVCAGAATWLQTGGKTSFSANSAAQLDVVEAEIVRVAENGETYDLDFTRKLLQKERRRRLLFPGFVALGVLALVGAVLVGRRKKPLASDEDARLLAAMGDPGPALEVARRKAAMLLHVTLDAPDAVIEAAFTAQLKDHDAATIEGLAPDLRQLVKQRREELTKARDLLLRKDA